MSDQIVLWTGNDGVTVSRKATPLEMVNLAKQLSERDKDQIIKAFDIGNYQMLSNYVWSKALATLKHNLSKMGAPFISEMLDRPDIKDDSDVTRLISDYDAVQLAEELGILNSTNALRLKQQMDLMFHYNNPELEDLDDDGFGKEDAILTLRYTIQGILGNARIEVALNFKEFRDSLEQKSLSIDDPQVEILLGASYFFHRTTIRVLLSLIKSSSGAQLENAIANCNVIIPQIWHSLKSPDKWQLGRTYAELNSEGKTKAVGGLKQVLLKVKGFDFVPEDLRSNSFIKVAHELLQTHSERDNFYHEPKVIRTLANMGNVPAPAVAQTFTAVLCVRLGNAYGISTAAQSYADEILKGQSNERWTYYLNEVFPHDDRVLFKLATHDFPLKRWIELVGGYLKNVNITIDQINKESHRLISLTFENKVLALRKEALWMYTIRQGHV